MKLKPGTLALIFVAVLCFGNAWLSPLGSEYQGYWIAGAACLGTFALMWQIIRARD